MFQHTAARRRLSIAGVITGQMTMFQHTAARRRLTNEIVLTYRDRNVSTHSRPKAADRLQYLLRAVPLVSTHSRPKAADD